VLKPLYLKERLLALEVDQSTSSNIEINLAFIRICEVNLCYSMCLCGEYRDTFIPPYLVEKRDDMHYSNLKRR